MTKESISHENGNVRVFANERAKVAWETIEAVKKIAGTLQPEGMNLDAQPISFAKRHRTRGLYVVFASGTVIGTGIEGTLLVPQRTLGILDSLEIPYKTLGPNSEQ